MCEQDVVAFGFPNRRKKKRPYRRRLLEIDFSQPSDLSDASNASMHISSDDDLMYCDDAATSDFVGTDDGMDKLELIRYCAGFILKSGISEDMAEELCERMPFLLTGRNSKIQYKNDVKRYMNSILDRVDIEGRDYCSQCFTQTTESICINRRCNRFRKIMTRGKGTARITLITASLRHQIQEIVQANFSLIYDFHDSFHKGLLKLNDPYDYRTFPYWIQHMEAREMFEKKEMTVLLSLTYDGAHYKRLSRNEVWPLFLEVSSLPVKIKGKLENSILSSIFYGSRKPSEELLEITFERLSGELRDLNMNMLDVNGWKFHVRIVSGHMDMAAQRLIFGKPAWNQLYGCSKCSIKGERNGNSTSERIDVSNAYSELLAKLRVDVLFSAMSKTAQSVATVKSQVKTSLPTSMELTFCRSRVSSLLRVEPMGDFKQISLVDLLAKWREPLGPSNYMKIVKVVRYVLGEITVVPDDIRKYSHGSMVGSKGRHTPLPVSISRTLEDLILQIAGLSSPIYDLPLNEAEKSTDHEELFQSLGDCISSRRKMFLKNATTKGKLWTQSGTIIMEALQHLRRSTCTIIESGGRKWTRQGTKRSREESQNVG